MGSRAYVLGILVLMGLFISASVQADQLFDAVEERDLEEVKRLLEQGADANAENGGYTALMMASSEEMASLLLSHGADVDVKTTRGVTALDAAYSNNVVFGPH